MMVAAAVRSKATATSGRRSRWPASPHASTPRTCRRSARRSTSARPREPYWQPVFKGYEFVQAVAEGAQAGRHLPGLQRSRHRLQPRHDSDLRDRHRRRIRAGRRGLGPAPGAEGDRPSEARRAHRAVGDPGRLRPHHRQQDGRRPRPHGAAQPDVRPARGLAVPGDPVRGQRRAVSGAVGPALLHARQGDPQGDRDPTTSRSTCRSGAPAA